MLRWYLEAFKKYADFQGRARRREYWFFRLGNTIAPIVLILSAVELIGTNLGIAYLIITMIFLVLFFLATIIPTLAVTVRRLHDIGKSGWWLLLPLSPYAIIFVISILASITIGIANIDPNFGTVFTAIVGVIGIIGILGSVFGIIGVTVVFLIWMFQDSQPGANKYGDNPKGIET